MSSMPESLSDLMAESLSFSNHPPEITRIPKDLLSRILLRLPLKSLGQSCCVCKSWNSLISSPTFIDQHLSSTRFESDSILVLSKLHRFPVDADPLYDLYSPPFDLENNHQTLETLPIPSEYGSNFPVGVVHGVVCIFRVVADPPERNVIFWNPLIHKHVSIPIPPRSMVEAFGYDPLTKQLKVVATRANRNSSQFEVEVASHRDRKWRKLRGDGCNHFGSGKDDMVFQIPLYDGCVNWLRYDEGNNGSVMYEHYYYEGFIHWLRYKEDGWFLTTFDCAKEEFQTIDMPDELVKCKAPRKFIWGPRGGESPEFDKLVAARCGELFSIQHMETNSYDCNMHIWVMYEYGEPNSWTKLYTIPSLGGLMKPKMAWEDDEVVLWFLGVVDFAAYDFTGSVLKRVIEHPNLVFDAHVFKESLLLMDG